ncbi:hypothetical protein [Micromonospora sp. NPDC023737]|uniref:hypothetical protein n=1 Tax=unclassified Micromonospora TaxID=2617518 RepID=UPI0033C68B1A
MTDPQLRDALWEEAAEQDLRGSLKRRELCREVLLRGCGLYHVAHYTSGVLDFALDLLEHSSAPPAVDGADARQRRDVHRRMGAQVVYRAVELDRRLWELQSGALIRMVVQAGENIFFCNSVVGSEHVVSFGAVPRAGDSAVADPTRVSEIDQAGAQLATDLRRLVRQPSLNPGGWSTATRRQADSSPRGADDEGVPLHVGGSTDLTGVFAAALRPAGLHYVSHYRAGERAAVADILAHPELAPFFNRGVTVADRRARYHRLAGDVSLLALQISRDLRRAVASEVTRLVLDVEMGAIYYYRVSADDYVFGVTLDQESVSQADRAVWTVARQLVETLP